ncbi:MAG: urate hydroxylase PuuD [Bacteroidia bacterium]
MLKLKVRNQKFAALSMGSKAIFLLLLNLLCINTYAAEKFTTNFNSTDLFIVLIPSLLVILILLALKQSIAVLEKEKAGQPEAGAEKINDRITELSETKTVLFYCSLFAVFLYLCYAFVQGTSYESHVAEWMNMVIRWMHVVFGIAWIGASFYFVFLENSLNRTKGLRDEIAGNLWAVHGGGFYYLEKYKIAPKQIPKDLHWFKYEAYFTWLSGFTLLIIVYYLDAKAYLVDPAVLDISQTNAILIGLGTLLFGWLVYDWLCKSRLSQNVLFFGVILFVFVSAVAWFLTHVFSSRAAYIHVGAMLGTLMAGNVFRVIIPGQKAMVNAAKQGRMVDPTYGKKALQRSLHNNYFTLPVIFIMISNHFPSTYGNALNWLVLMGLSLASVFVKHYLNLKEKGEKSIWILPAGIAGIIGMAMVTSPKTKSVCKEDAPASFTEVNEIITTRCVPCHSSNPTDDVLKTAPNSIMFDNPETIAKYAERIMARAVITKTMPQANKTGMTQEERDKIQCWIESGANIK